MAHLSYSISPRTVLNGVSAAHHSLGVWMDLKVGNYLFNINLWIVINLSSNEVLDIMEFMSV